MELRDEIAAQLLDRDEGGGEAHITWARTLVLNSKEDIHDGDCTDKPQACNRCIIDQVLADADHLIAIVRKHDK